MGASLAGADADEGLLNCPQDKQSLVGRAVGQELRAEVVTIIVHHHGRELKANLMKEKLDQILAHVNEHFLEILRARLSLGESNHVALQDRQFRLLKLRIGAWCRISVHIVYFF